MPSSQGSEQPLLCCAAVAPEPTFSVAQPSCRLERLAEISEQDVIKAAMSLNNSVTPTRYQLGYSRKTLNM